MNATIVIGGVEYQAAPLRLKHVKAISQILSQRSSNPVKATGYAYDIEPWVPFIVDALKPNQPNITPDIVEDMTLQEFNDAWNIIVNNSGIKVTGEKTPKAESTGNLYTGDSAALSDGHIENVTSTL